ncbi:porin family protein [Rhizobiaceae bacterium n13]|uniref:Porin family protein n=1 Tax=Ferirhizobium litorale TaxID=2927786 RepID=A0AAE3U2N7_9HYPH|nr:porin family protein [Fererhizobium litorale]MDI7861062.1 porin family protein [Fererhizobium litorale]MDI7921209.1 porin family protein [Fererhizobium litorale]
MHTLIKTLMASSVAVLAFTAAQAADAIDQIPEAPVADVIESAPAGWQGAYIGGAGTYNMGRFQGHGDYDAKAFGGAAYGGYNWQQGQIVYGGEADLGYSGADATRDGVKSEQRANGSVRGRVGYDLNPVLVYGTAGVAVAQDKASDATSSDKKVAAGYTVGGGIETFVTDNVTARAEYRYTDMQSKSYDLDSGRVSRGYDEHSVKLGIGVKF